MLSFGVANSWQGVGATTGSGIDFDYLSGLSMASKPAGIRQRIKRYIFADLRVLLQIIDSPHFFVVFSGYAWYTFTIAKSNRQMQYSISF